MHLAPLTHRLTPAAALDDIARQALADFKLLAQPSIAQALRVKCQQQLDLAIGQNRIVMAVPDPAAQLIDGHQHHSSTSGNSTNSLGYFARIRSIAASIALLLASPFPDPLGVSDARTKSARASSGNTP